MLNNPNGKRGDGLDVTPPAAPKQTNTPEFSFPSPESFARSSQSDSGGAFSSGSMFNRQQAPNTKGKKRLGPIKLNRKYGIIAAAVVGVLVAGIGAAYSLTRPAAPAPEPAPLVEQPKEEPQPVVHRSQLTGIAVSEAQSKLPITGVMIENSPDARPQAGLKDAGIVYEAVAEAGITRFLALYQETEPDYIGPVRSVRPYYIDWLRGYDASIAHVGGSPEALALIRSEGVKDLDQFANPGAYWRISSRYAPHNMYTSFERLRQVQNANGYTQSTFTGFLRKEPAPVNPAPVVQINMELSRALYNVHYDYHAETGTYKRSEGGRPHTDERTGEQLAPKVVVAIVVPYGIQADGLHSEYQTIGSGKAYIFQDGTVTEGLWEKRSPTDGMRFGDANGSPIAINAGQSWITAITAENKINYGP